MKTTAEEAAAARQRVREETWSSGNGAILMVEADGRLGRVLSFTSAHDELKRERATLASAAPEMYRALKAREWDGIVEFHPALASGFMCCPECEAPRPGTGQAERLMELGYTPGKHDAACTLAAAIRKAEG